MIMRKFEILQVSPKCDTEKWSEQMLLVKMMLTAQVGCMRQVLGDLVHWEDPEGSGGEGGGKGDRDGEYM